MDDIDTGTNEGKAVFYLTNEQPVHRIQPRKNDKALSQERPGGIVVAFPNLYYRTNLSLWGHALIPGYK